jgi:hypothetical protein
MTLFGEVDALADDVVAAVFNLNDKAVLDFHAVAYGHGIGAPNAAQSEVALDFIIGSQSIVCQDGVPTAGILDDESFQ